MRLRMIGAAALAASMATAAQADSYSTGFEASDGFVAGTSPGAGASEGNSGWVQASNGSTSGTYVSGVAHSGTQSLAVSNNGSGNDGVIHGIRSPELAAGAGETQSGAPNNFFSASWWIRSGAATAAENIATGNQFVSINAWSNDRMTWFGWDAEGGVLTASVSGMDAADNFSDQILASNLDFGRWYQVVQTVNFTDSNGNGGGDDIVTFSLYDDLGGLVGNQITTSWDAGYLQPGTFYPTASLSPVDQMNIRSAFTSAGINAYLDDIGYTAAAVPEPATWAMMIAGFGFVGGAMRRQSRPKPAFA